MSASTARPDLDLIHDVIFGEYHKLTQEERGRAHWVMAPGMWAFIRQAEGERLSSWLRQILWLDDAHQVRLLGKPVEEREGAEGIRLVVDEVPQ